jgi:hypothetical protein
VFAIHSLSFAVSSSKQLSSSMSTTSKKPKSKQANIMLSTFIFLSRNRKVRNANVSVTRFIFPLFTSFSLEMGKKAAPKAKARRGGGGVNKTALKRKMSVDLHKFKAHTLHSGPGKKHIVTSRKQAMAIAYSQARKGK